MVAPAGLQCSQKLAAQHFCLLQSRGGFNCGMLHCAAAAGVAPQASVAGTKQAAAGCGELLRRGHAALSSVAMVRFDIKPRWSKKTMVSCCRRLQALMHMRALAAMCRGAAVAGLGLT